MKKSYGSQDKSRYVKIINDNEKTVLQVSRELGLSQNTVYRWIREEKHIVKNLKAENSTEIETNEIIQGELLARIRKLERENETLRETIKIFSQYKS